MSNDALIIIDYIDKKIYFIHYNLDKFFENTEYYLKRKQSILSRDLSFNVVMVLMDKFMLGGFTLQLMERIIATAQNKTMRIVLPEGHDSRIVAAADQITKARLADIILLGSTDEVQRVASEAGVSLSGIEIINPHESDRLEEYGEKFYELRKHKGVSKEEAVEKVKDPLYYSTIMVKLGDADGSVAGAVNTTGEVLRPAFQIIKTAPGISAVSGAFFMVLDHELMSDGLMVFADCAVNPNPDPCQLAEIALASAKTAQILANIEPRVAMLSSSTKGSGKDENVEKVREATKIARKMAPELMIDGEFQVDSALVPKVGKQKAPNSSIAGNANVFIFPDLQSGNIGYKLVQRLANAEAIGPVLQGLAKPINDLSRGCSIDDVVNLVAITAVIAQNQT